MNYRQMLLMKIAAQAQAAAEQPGPQEEAREDAQAGQLGSVLAQLIAHMRALHLWMHGAHHVSKGPSFGGDHVSILNSIYDEIQDQVDKLVEKAIGLTGDQSLGSPTRVMEDAMEVLGTFPDVATLPQDNLMSTARDLELMFIKVLEQHNQELQQSGQLSLGLGNFLAGLADTHESYAYFLRQRSAPA